MKDRPSNRIVSTGSSFRPSPIRSKLSVKNVGSMNALRSQGKQCDADGDDYNNMLPERLFLGIQ